MDTGSVVSLVSQTFYQEHLSSISNLQPVGNILNIECADGENLPYIGYIETDITVEEELSDSKSLPCLFLVTLDTRYSERTPIILGTNVLQELMKGCSNKHGERFLQIAPLRNPWYLSFRTLCVRDRELSRKKNRLAVVKCAATQKIISTQINPWILWDILIKS